MATAKQVKSEGRAYWKQADEGTDILRDRGILSPARHMGWAANGKGWKYPIFDAEGNAVGQRWKAYDSGNEPKYLWLGKARPKYYFFPAAMDVIQSTHTVYLASGEPDVLAYYAAGVVNAVCWFGENSPPKTLAADLTAWGVRQVIGFPDRDKTGDQWAKKIHKLLANTDIAVKLYRLPEKFGDKADINKLWIETGFNQSLFSMTLKGCEPYPAPSEPPATAKPLPLPAERTAIPDRFLDDIEARLNYQPGKNVVCPIVAHENDHKAPGAQWNRETATLYCHKCGKTYLAKEVGEKFGLNIADYFDKPKPKADGDGSPTEGNAKPSIDVRDDAAIADYIMSLIDGRFAYIREQWHEYDNGVWQPSVEFDIFIIETLKTLRPHGVKANNSRATSVATMLSKYLKVADEKIDNGGGVVSLMNGLYNLETHELEPHDPQRYLTSQLGFAYEPAADSPCFDGFLRSVLTDNETYWFILEAIGYSVTDDTRRRASFWLVGPSASGKSTLLNVIIALAGSSHAGINLNELNQNSYAAAAIAGKRLVTFTEPDSNSVLPDGQYKRLVSSDTVTARMPYGKPFDFVPQAKLWGAMNEPPRVYDRSEAVFDRVYIIPFPRSIPVNERDYELEEKLKAEVAGIFNTAMFGLKRLQRNNGFTHSKVIEAARREFRNDNDTEAQFIEDMCQLRGEVDSQALYESYRGWCLRNGNQPKGKRRVGSDFKRFGVTSRKSNGRTIYTGITLRAMT